MQKSKTFLWNLLSVLIWIIFVSYCVQAGTLLFTVAYSYVKPEVAGKLYLDLNLSSLRENQLEVYLSVCAGVIMLLIAKAYLFYQVIRISIQLQRVKPFSSEVAAAISSITRNAFAVGILGIVGTGSIAEFTKQGMDFSTLAQFCDDSTGYLAMSAVMFVIDQIFKRGVELQTENDLTV
ncbi:MAG TPA: DUF2975 domain-containing protein [Luteibaculaceae bacterium]|nr:DUF2975 domain-containing protein [Luteibaculaceae bacterium]